MMRRGPDRTIEVWNDEVKDWLPFGKLYGTDVDALRWNLKRGTRTRYRGIEVVLRNNNVEAANPVERMPGFVGGAK